MEALKTVLAGAIGIRRKAAAEKPVNPLHVVLVAVAFFVLFILSLVAIVRIVTS
jgi:DUF2970 family protein